jgi:4-hydroxybenzoate polyprenyltransferase
MNQINLFLELTRLKRPIGYMLLFWPCAWGLTLVYDFSSDLNTYYFYLILFFLGSVLMRSAGCIVNDVLDRKFDKKVLRTKGRPIASGKITVFKGLVYATILCLLAFLVLINFNYFTIFLALASMPLAFTYPLMKRYTYWPQLFLGITFNYGLILGWTSIEPHINILPTIFYLGAIFWTLGYDTIYGYQDIKDDEIIGVKSTSIKFRKNPIKFLTMTYLLFFISILYINYNMSINIVSSFSLLLIFYYLFFYQIAKFKKNQPKLCLKIFKSNNFLGLLVYVNILIGKLI